MRSSTKRLAVLLTAIFASCGGGGNGRYDQNVSVPKGDPPFPPLASSWVIDKARVLSESARAEGDVICQKLKEDGIAEMVIVIIDSVKHPEDWATHYGRWLGLGRKGMSVEGGNNGVVWLVRPDAAQKVTISVGRGLPDFTSADFGPILNDAAEYFNFNNYNGGVAKLVDETDRALRKLYGNRK